MKYFFTLLLIVLTTATKVPSEECRVETKDFTIIGTVANLPSNDITYERYICIQYAKPPIEDLRYAPSVIVNPKGIIYANKDTCPVCPQLRNKQIHPNSNEDCLFLNVFVPRNCGKGPLPVIIYIHGGSFEAGNGPLLPSFLLGKCVIVVSFNYRLGALGFLSLQTPQCAGNAGIKDQQLAMIWVKNHIKHFGGDPLNIVIYGLSAGGASVSYHYLNEKSCSLFNGAISESGVALNVWAFANAEKIRSRSQTLAANVGCTGESDEELCECLKKVPADIILYKTNSVLDIWDVATFRVVPFTITTEPKESPEPFLLENPFDLFKKGLHCKQDLIIGVTKDEGCVFASTIQQYKFALPFLTSLIKYTAPSCIADNPDPYCNDYVTTEMLNYYADGGEITEDNIYPLITDVQFKNGIIQFAQMMTQHGAKVYLYEFTYSGECSISKQLIPGTTMVCHGETLGYAFITPFTSSCFDTKESKDAIISSKLISFYAEFAKFGNPTPLAHWQNTNIYWLPWNRYTQIYLEIGENLKIKTCFESEAMAFWNQISKECCEGSIGKNSYPTCPRFNILSK